MRGMSMAGRFSGDADDGAEAIRQSAPIAAGIIVPESSGGTLAGAGPASARYTSQ